jgi:cell wall-associated NlpC family hydrolase
VSRRKRSSGLGVLSAVGVGTYMALHVHLGGFHLDSVKAPTHAARVAVRYAEARIGLPYQWGGTGPDGFDCSGLTSMAWKHAGVTIPRTSQEQWAGLRHVSKPAPGDLVFSYWTDPADPASPNHVQIYAGHGDVIGADTTDVERVPLSTDAGHIVGYANPTAR